MPILEFGKHKGQDISDVPLSYVQWLEENSKGPTQLMAQNELKRRSGESVATKLPRDVWVSEFQKLVEKMPNGLLGQVVKYKNLEIMVKINDK